MPKGGKSGDATCDEATCERVVSLLRMPRIFDIEKGKGIFLDFPQQRFVLHKNLHLTKLGKIPLVFTVRISGRKISFKADEESAVNAQVGYSICYPSKSAFN